MSKWTDVRDSIEDTIKKTEVTEEVKQDVTQKLYDVVLPTLRNVGNGFTDVVKAQSAGETGWCKIRDAIVLPAVIQFGLWLIEMTLRKTITATAGKDVAAS